ncbi:HPr family phosphocarrier protein [Agromyces sp. LHK192]|uniref:HPr family phosphocarrier protein n=1 Tax=Agromyces sp. LHK192 TaxID=2498704 RepID=UPI000FDB5CD0|nr:HPr family phosphocarrier protein [Agromyces sp. LHK192]
MVERTVRIGSTHGLHARPAKLFTQAVAASGSSVTIAKGDGAPVNAASILAVIAQGIDHGDEVTLVVDGGDEARVLDDLVDLLLTDHDG